MAAGHSLILLDDYSLNLPAVRGKWHRWESSNKIKSLFCHIEDRVCNGYRKGWCLGRFINQQTFVLEQQQNESASTIDCDYPLPPSQPEQQALQRESSSIQDRSDYSPFSSWASCKYLVYTVVGADRVFNDVVSWNVKSLYASILRNPPLCKIDIVVFTDKVNFHAMAPLVKQFGIRLHEVPYTADPVSNFVLLFINMIDSIYSKKIYISSQSYILLSHSETKI